MKTKHLFLLATLALTLFACEHTYDAQLQECIVDFSYKIHGINSSTITFESKCVCAGEIENYAWDFGDGTVINEPGTKGTQTHKFDKPGEYKVTLHVVWRDAKNAVWSKGVYEIITIKE